MSPPGWAWYISPLHGFYPKPISGRAWLVVVWENGKRDLITRAAHLVAPKEGV